MRLLDPHRNLVYQLISAGYLRNLFSLPPLKFHGEATWSNIEPFLSIEVDIQGDVGAFLYLTSPSSTIHTLSKFWLRTQNPATVTVNVWNETLPVYMLHCMYLLAISTMPSLDTNSGRLLTHRRVPCLSFRWCQSLKYMVYLWCEALNGWLSFPRFKRNEQ